MKKEFTAKTVEEAKALAVQEFGVEEEKITFTVVEEPKKGLLFTKGEAKIEAEYEQTKEEAAAEYIIAVLKQMGFEDATIDISPIENGALLDIKAEGFSVLACTTCQYEIISMRKAFKLKLVLLLNKG